MKNDIVKADFIKSEAQFSFELEGKSEIDAQALSQILSSTVDIVEEIIRNEPDTYVNLKVTKFRNDSFDIDFQAVAEQAVTLMSSPDAIAAYLVGAVCGVFKIAKHLNGSRPQKIENSGDDAQITNVAGNTLITSRKTADKYFSGAKIENSIINIVNVVKQDEERQGFQIKDNVKNEVVEYTKENIHAVAPVVEGMIIDEAEVFENTIQTFLIIRKPDLYGDSKWGFIFDKNIDATIEDKAWLERIHAEKVRFGPGMRIQVELKTEVSLDKSGNVIKGSERYRVLKVIGDIIEAEKDHQIGM
ncbi:MAG TPA: hypothetical protein DF480_01485 [Clostridiales bacterium]|nr:hypothetical protein [Clostridiales bacterium]